MKDLLPRLYMKGHKVVEPRAYRFARYGKPHRITRKEDELINNARLSAGRFVTLLAAPMKITRGAKQSLISYFKTLVQESERIGDSDYYEIGVRVAVQVKSAKRKVKRRHGEQITLADLNIP